jgi:menaquinol-cytochrome c reductase iron-sulfur subunit
LGCSYGFDATKGVFRCPCHEGVFEFKTGKVLAGPPPRPLDQLPTRIDDGQLYVDYREFHLGVADKNIA